MCGFKKAIDKDNGWEEGSIEGGLYICRRGGSCTLHLAQRTGLHFAFPPMCSSRYSLCNTHSYASEHSCDLAGHRKELSILVVRDIRGQAGTKDERSAQDCLFRLPTPPFRPLSLSTSSLSLSLPSPLPILSLGGARPSNQSPNTSHSQLQQTPQVWTSSVIHAMGWTPSLKMPTNRLYTQS